jgi:UDP-galactopyranose mutase
VVNTGTSGDGGRPLLFYSAWPLGYHNPEAERKALGFARGGYDVVYVAGIGLRNPRLSNVTKLTDRVGRRLRTGPGRGAAAGRPELSAASVLVAPPRQWAAMRRLNDAWLARQLQRVIAEWSTAVAWVRWPTPELVDALRRLRPAATVYECVDPYHLSPGMVGPWPGIHEAAERALVNQAAVVVVPGEALAERFRARGADVRVVPHGVDLVPWRARNGHGDRRVVGFAGTLDYRLDGDVLRAVAEAHPDWELRLIGPVQEGFPLRAVAGLGNVTVLPPVPHPRLGPVLADFDAGILPYRDTDLYRFMAPLKNLELLAAGRPAVARLCPAVAPYADVVYLADTPGDFVAQLERALAEDSPARAAARRRRAEAATWDRTIEALLHILEEVLP